MAKGGLEGEDAVGIVAEKLDGEGVAETVEMAIVDAGALAEALKDVEEGVAVVAGMVACRW